LRDTTGNGNTAIGEGSGTTITTGAKNTILGRFNGNQNSLDIRTASNYIVLSDGDGNPRQIQDGSGNIFWKGSGAGVQTLAGITAGTSDAKGIDNSDGARLLSSRASTASREHYIFYNPNGQVGSITTSASATLFNVTSDQRLKENIVDAPEFGGVIDSLQVRSFDWKADQTHQRAGFIAQELVTVAPEAVYQPTDTDQMMAVDYSKLVPMLVKEIQSLRKRLADAGI